MGCLFLLLVFLSLLSTTSTTPPTSPPLLSSFSSSSYSSITTSFSFRKPLLDVKRQWLSLFFHGGHRRDEPTSPSSPSPYHSSIAELKELARYYLSTLENFATSSTSPASYWEILGKEEDIQVWRLKKPVIPSSISTSSDYQRWPCFRASLTLPLPLQNLRQLLEDSNQATFLNKYCQGREDIELREEEEEKGREKETSRIIHTRTKIPYTIKPFDFSTLMHTCPLSRLNLTTSSSPSSIVILSKGISHEKIKPTTRYGRSEILFGLNLLQVNRQNVSCTDLVIINHIKYAGTFPFIVRQTGYQGTLDYLKNLRRQLSLWRSSQREVEGNDKE